MRKSVRSHSLAVQNDAPNLSCWGVRLRLGPKRWQAGPPRTQSLPKVRNSGKSRAAARADDAGSGARKAGARSRVLRIIAGRHRGRRLQFPAGVEIRPTPDRVRETLFNWLQPRIDQARVLDLFAGSGALGLEALSRGAAHVTFVEKDRRAAAAIESVAQRMGRSERAGGVCRSARMAGGARRRATFRHRVPRSAVRLRTCWKRPRPRLPAGSLPMRACTSSAARVIRCRRCRAAGKSSARVAPARSGIICSPHETKRRLSRNLRPDHQRPPGPGAPGGERVRTGHRRDRVEP